ncbi:hypothetical protein PTSG_09954 [Salpingoeca rosetta]|uniref:Photosynthesis system II assembly factor Ycf48/Hcf136-like domain-containing protein n=1 Tax=Salpingoeca rosetta (strain ATCC 50818 / BSB-021) TaxID=946362 RepID=F2UNM8_SALR5|nr:uncharacterized protein PTSG_09954 [Salpingoeca rosetta]EGD79233.1 hypothetical protein PTSG_09954 [Salpingoeca rosetta]|eukprot:XP_004989318.1 hypothetical protein PTSG_09954 [Salpingoeca rosetta]
MRGLVPSLTCVALFCRLPRVVWLFGCSSASLRSFTTTLFLPSFLASLLSHRLVCAKMNCAVLAVVACVALAIASPVRAIPTWSVVAKDLLTTDLGIAFPEANTGYTAGDANGAGPAILKSTDGGHTWNQCNATFGPDLLLLAATAAKDAIVVTSIFGELYSDDDGNSFHLSVGGGMSQSARYIGVNGDGGKRFGVAGTYHGRQGVAISEDGGKLFKAFTTDELFTYSRYGAYPTDSTWYVAAGEFPSTNATEAVRPDLPARYRRSEFMAADGRFPASYNRTADPNVAGYKAQIVKTTDGGNTWSTLFAQNDTFYFNGIDCNPSDPNHCCAVGESADGADAGARIYCTFDGQNFNRTFYAPYTQAKGYSLIDFRFANETFGWAVGGTLNAIAPSAWFVVTNDGGRTWDAQTHTIPGYYALGLDVVSEKVAYAAVDNLITQTSGVAKYFAL